MLKQDKAEEIRRLKELVATASALYFVDFSGVGANEFNRLRRRLAETGAKVRVVKNRLALRALGDAGVTGDFGDTLRGPTSMVFATGDPVAPARVLRQVGRELEMLSVKGAYVDSKVYAADGFTFLAGLPTLDELRSQLVGLLAAPVFGFGTTLEALLGEFVYVLGSLEARIPGDEGSS